MFFVFCIFIIPLTVLVILLLSTKQKNNTEITPTEINRECAICYDEYPIAELLEKEIGDYGKKYVFCGNCIETLYHDYKNKISFESGE
ncbi:hypothetical protein C6497_04985 [Candidatus Poribacteria bacterium]|nr:MAG: hypothetical protein C6497_04985 [Candidatus Poribacteria bacterium]